MGPEIDRRGLFRLLAGGIGVGLLPLSALAQDEPGLTDGEKASLLAPGEILPHWQSAVAIGSQVATEHQDFRDLASLLQGLGIDASTLAAADESEFARQRQRWQQAHRADFLEGRTRVVGGWTLSLTEQRLAALLALLGAEGRFQGRSTNVIRRVD